VTLDLNGHTISTDIRAHGSYTKGINNEGGHDNLTIENGTITGGDGGFDFPIYSLVRDYPGCSPNCDGADGTRITKVNVKGRHASWLAFVRDLTITNSTILGGAGSGVNIIGSGRILVENNRFSGIGVRPLSGPHIDALIRHNVVTGGIDSVGIGVSTDFGAIIEHNDVTGDAYCGICASGAVIRHNRVVRNHSDGIRAVGSSTVSHNTANYNEGLGINADPTVIDGGGNKAKGNGNPLQCVTSSVNRGIPRRRPCRRAQSSRTDTQYARRAPPRIAPPQWRA
jgi:hypothetical protein